jgi:hypothetical protein
MGSQTKTLGRGGSRSEQGESGKPRVRIDAKVRAHLGHKLKTAYQALVDEPVPDRFTKLLEELRQKEGKS